MFKIKFVSADDGGISLNFEDFDYNWLNKHQLARAMIKYDCSEAHFTSSMDFASEYGFPEDGDAKKMFYEATVIASAIMKEEES